MTASNPENTLRASRKVFVTWALCLITAAATVGCAAVDVASRPTLFRTTRGVEAFVDSAPEKVEARARTALAELGIDKMRYEVSADGAGRLLEGRVGDLDVSVAIRRDTSTSTRTEVVARRSPVTWDRRAAVEVLNRIVTLS